MQKYVKQHVGLRNIMQLSYVTVKNISFLIHMAHEENAPKPQNTMVATGNLIYVEGTVTKVAGQRIGIYIYDRYSKRIADFVGRRVKLVILDVSED